jgi:hypothetical protein
MNENTIQRLKESLRGELIQPGEPGYDESRTIWNAMIDRRPSLIARCLGVADVVTCVNFAREENILISIKGGGHNISGLSLADDALTIDMSLMRGVWVDAKNSVAQAQPGCILGDVDRETQLHGLAAVLGFVSKTGIAGLTLGGGFGYLSRRWGWTSDNVLSINVVTAEGQLVRASETENPDLFWGLRGGGGNFGVATNFEYRLYPVGPQIVGGAIAWKGEDAPDVLEMYREVVAGAPPEHACVAVMRNAPPVPWLPKDIHGKPIIALFVCDTGSLDNAEERVAPIKAFGSPVGDIIGRMPYTKQQSILDATQPSGRRYYWKSEYLPGLESGLLEKVIRHAARIESPHSAVVLFPLGGAIRDLSDDHSAVGNRNAEMVVNATASWELPEEDEKNIGWAQSTWEDIREFSTGGTYLNFLTEEEVGDRLYDAFGEKNFDRLIDIKTKWDPTNLFKLNKNIVPR